MKIQALNTYEDKREENRQAMIQGKLDEAMSIIHEIRNDDDLFWNELSESTRKNIQGILNQF